MCTIVVYTFEQFTAIISKPIPEGGIRIEWLEAGSNHPTVFTLNETGTLPFMNDRHLKPLKQFWRKTSNKKTKQKAIKLETDATKYTEKRKPVYSGTEISFVRRGFSDRSNYYYFGKQSFARVQFFGPQVSNGAIDTPRQFWLYRRGSFTVHNGGEDEANEMVLQLAERITGRKMCLTDETIKGIKK